MLERYLSTGSHYKGNELFLDVKEGGIISGNERVYEPHVYPVLVSSVSAEQVASGILVSPTLVLDVTQKCNFACRYCPYHAEDNLYVVKDGNSCSKVANPDLRVEQVLPLVDFLCQGRRQRTASALALSFYGGEPLLNKEFLRRVVIYCVRNWKDETAFHINTNGSCISDEDIEFFIRHNISLSISLDGGRASNRNRVFKGSHGRETFFRVVQSLEKIRSRSEVYYRDKVMISSVLSSSTCVDEFLAFLRVW